MLAGCCVLLLSDILAVLALLFHLWTPSDHQRPLSTSCQAAPSRSEVHSAQLLWSDSTPPRKQPKEATNGQTCGARDDLAALAATGLNQ